LQAEKDPLSRIGERKKSPKEDEHLSKIKAEQELKELKQELQELKDAVAKPRQKAKARKEAGGWAVSGEAAREEKTDIEVGKAEHEAHKQIKEKEGTRQEPVIPAELATAGENEVPVKGIAKLVITSPANLHQLQDIQRYLNGIDEIHVVMVGGSTEGSTQIAVSLNEPVMLLSALKNIPLIDKASVVDGAIYITLVDSK
jgi:sugar-specific transcriptional regulator TrmB